MWRRKIRTVYAIGVVLYWNPVVALKTEQRLQAELAARERADGELAGALHEVSNALTVVLGWLQHAQEQLPQGPVAEAVEVARTHAALGHGIARRAVGATPSESGELRSAMSLVRQMVVSVTPEANRRGVQIQMLESTDDALVAHAGAVQQIILNLLLNALSFTPKGRGIRFSLLNEGALVVFRIQDDGPGVPAELRAGLFVSSHSMRPGGAGIGLSHSHRLAERHGGNLALLQRPGSGACFELRWPCNDSPSGIGRTCPDAVAPVGPEPRKTDNPTVQIPKFAGMQVAILEDDNDVMGMLELGLSSRGVTLYTLSNRDELYRFAEEGPAVDAILIDLSPIAADPQSAILRLRKRSPKAAIYLISGTVLSTDAGPDIDGWIRKPFELGEIYQALTQVRANRK